MVLHHERMRMGSPPPTSKKTSCFRYGGKPVQCRVTARARAGPRPVCTHTPYHSSAQSPSPPPTDSSALTTLTGVGKGSGAQEPQLAPGHRLPQLRLGHVRGRQCEGATPHTSPERRRGVRYYGEWWSKSCDGRGACHSPLPPRVTVYVSFNLEALRPENLIGTLLGVRQGTSQE